MLILGQPLMGLTESSWAADSQKSEEKNKQEKMEGSEPSPPGQEDPSKKVGEVPKEGAATLKQLTTYKAITARPCWSPDGSKIVFHSTRSQEGGSEGEDGKKGKEDGKKGKEEEKRVNRDIWMIDRDGTNLKRLTTSNADEYNPVFSPDGKRIVYVSEENDNRDIWAMNADGTSKAPLTLDKGMEQDPAWSPDGAMIAFSALRLQTGGNFDLWIIGSDGSNPRRLTKLGGNEAAPSWHPDGKHIAYHSDDNGNLDIYTVDIKGKDITRIIGAPAQESRPIFSPDGAKIAYSVWGKDQSQDQVDVWIANIDGSEPYRLTHNPPSENGRWSPDSMQMVFQSKRTGFWEIWAQEVPLDVLRSGKFAYVGMVRGREGFDLLNLRNGDSLTGTILNPEITLRSSYSELKFPRGILATLRFPEGKEGLGEVIALNGDKFSGFVLEKDLKFRLRQGAVMEVRMEKVDTVGFGYQPGEPQKFPESPQITLRNGDLFSGKMLSPQMIINTGYADVTIHLEEVAKIENSGTDKVVTRVTLVNGDILQGELKGDDLRIGLDIGLALDIYKDRVMAINLNRKVRIPVKKQDETKGEVISQGASDKQVEPDGED